MGQKAIVSPPFSGKTILNHEPLKKSQFGELISNITISKSSFNPGIGENVNIYYNITKPAEVILNIYDPDYGLVKKISKKITDSGKMSFIWDGKDLDNHIVPDEAYFFMITAKDHSGNMETYDPTLFSGGFEHQIRKAKVDILRHTITYRMPEIGRVLFRLGIHGGPLLNTLVDWKPRLDGVVTEFWNGKDAENKIYFYKHPKFKMRITYFSFPENSIISYGNKKVSFKQYKATNKRPKKEINKQNLLQKSPHYALQRVLDYSPEVFINFSNILGKDDDGIPIIKNKTIVKVTLNDQDKLIFQNQQFEICFFLDYEFYAEDEAGYTPFNWLWNLSNVSEGVHLLTVNITSYKDQIGVVSRKVRIIK